MLTGLALAALLIGGVSTAIVVTDEQRATANDQAPVVEVQQIETVNPFTE